MEAADLGSALRQFPIVAIAGSAWVATRDLSRYQTRLTEQIRKVTGRELAAKVPLAVKLGSEPAMVAEGVTLSNATWGSRPDLARVRKLTLFIDPVSLFLGEIKIGRILLEGADILVEPTTWATPTSTCCRRLTDRAPIPGENRSLPRCAPPGVSLDRRHRGARFGPRPSPKGRAGRRS